MAQISLNISSSDGSSFVIHDYKPAHGLISILIDTNLPSGTPYARDWVMIHGTDADLREFARRISAAFPLDEQQARKQAVEWLSQYRGRVDTFPPDEQADEREEPAPHDDHEYAAWLVGMFRRSGQPREDADEREESAREDAEQNETGAMRCPPRE
jgi:hypothetical protein